MKKVKPLLYLAMTLFLCLAAAACGNKTPESTNGENLDFEGLVFEDAEFTYDGTPKSLTLKGYPITANVKYSDNAVQTDAGVYEITATVSKSGYNTKTLSATMTINKAELGISFVDKSVVYDGKAHDVLISGELPQNASVSYQGNGQTKAGEYTVTAVISGFENSDNYVTSYTANLKIKKAVYDMSEVSFNDGAVKYDGSYHTLSVLGQIPEGVSVSYEGGGIEVGEYTVRAKFDGDFENYESIPDMTAKLTVAEVLAESFKVSLDINLPDGVIAENGTEQFVLKGGSAIFNVTIKSAYVFSKVSHGTYNESGGILVIQNIQQDTEVKFEVYELGYDRNDTVVINFIMTPADTASIENGSSVNLGQKIILTAKDPSRKFSGWSIGKPLLEGGTLLSNEEVFVFEVIPDLIGADVSSVVIYSNYLDVNVLVYDVNGGQVDTSSVNMKGNSYYTAVNNEGRVTVTISDEYIDFAESASTFWDDGSFYRDGYVLTEYNTKPDATGESYSLGSKFYTGSTSEQTLYCIWSKASPESDFEYSNVRWGYAADVTATTAPHWKVNGVKITKYNGDDECVVIPEKLGGKYVTTIDTGAFVNKNVKTIVFSRFIIRVNDGAFKGCDELTTVYMTDGIYYMNDAAFDSATYTNFKNFYLNATIAPRFAKNSHGDGAVFSVKLSRLLASQDKNRVIVVSGSSTYQGMSTPYLEALLDEEYTVINLGTTRTGTGLIFFEALSHYVHDGDIVVYSPENHVNMFGQNTMWYRSFYDLEGMYNLFRYIDISHYPSVFSALSSYNRERRLIKEPTAYEDIANGNNKSDKYGDFQQNEKNYYCGESTVKYIDSYFLTFNKYFKNDLNWSDVTYQTENKDYLTNSTWTDITVYKDEVNRAISAVKAGGADVYFGFAPSDAEALVPEARNSEWLLAYDSMILENFDFDGLLGTSKDYIFARKYFYDCAYHVNNYGRTYRTYQMYLDLCDIIGKEDKKAIDAEGVNFKGCLFEQGSDGTPVTKVDYLQN